MLTDDLERLAERGPHRDPDQVLDSAFHSVGGQRSHRSSILAAAAVVVGVVGLGAVVSLRDTEPAPPPFRSDGDTTDTPAPSSASAATSTVGEPAVSTTEIAIEPTTTAGSTTTASTTTVVPTTGVPTTVAPQTTVRAATPPPATSAVPPSLPDAPLLLGPVEFGDWLGPFGIDPEPLEVELGSTGSITWSISITVDSTCVDLRADGSDRAPTGRGCSGRPSATEWTDEPRTLGAGENLFGPDLVVWAFYFHAPADVTIGLVAADGQPMCEMRRFGLESYGDSALWVCEGTDPPPDGSELIIARRGDDTVIYDDQFPP